MKFKDAAAVCFAVAIGAVVMMIVFRACRHPTPAPEPQPSASASSSSAPEPSGAPSTTPSASSSPVAERKPLDPLPKRACYGMAESGADITSREASPNDWKIPYPYRLVFRGDRPWDCGFFPELHGDGWRTAYCIEDGLRSARVVKKLYISVRSDLVRPVLTYFRIDDDSTPAKLAQYEETECPR
jgi:hypothetical protein